MRARRDVYQAIADPTRRAIIHLIASEPMDIKSLTARFDMSQQAVSLHVKVLSDCGLVRMEQRGRNRFCRPQLDKLSEVAEWVAQYRGLKQNVEKLGRYLSSQLKNK